MRLRRQVRSLPSFCVFATCVFLLVFATTGYAASCPVLHAPPASDADTALLAGRFSDAENLYRTAMAAHRGDVRLTVGLVHSLLRQQKVQDAADAVAAALAATPKNADLIVLRGEVELRQGTPWDAVKSAYEAQDLDICNPRMRLLMAELDRMDSLYASAQQSLHVARQLAPDDPEIREEWLMDLPLKSRIAELESYLAEPRGDDPDDVRELHATLDHWKKLRDEPRKPCRLVSDVTSTEVPMSNLMYDARHIRAFGLDVKLNNHTARLEIDTGASGLLVTRSVAQRAGLKAFSQSTVGGVGDEGDRLGYMAYADSIRIGGLEFQNCAVEVLDSKHGLEDEDGLIGMDVLSHFLVTLDYPMRKIVLGPLPPRPGDSPTAKPELNTGDGLSEGTEDEDGKGQTADTRQDGAEAQPHGPRNRYIAPEMKNYTKVYRVGHDLILPASLNNSKIRLFILDTGAWSTTISPQAAREVTKVHKDYDLRVSGISGKVQDVFKADNIEFRFANLSQKARDVAAFDTSKISKSVGTEISGFLGATTLELLTIHIDYRDGLVKFDYDPNRGYRF